MRHSSRRTFLGRSVHAAAGVAAADLAFLSSLDPVRAQETKVDPQAVQFRSEIEPLVRFLEDTPRGKLLEGVAAKIRSGTTYREVLTALLLAGVRNVQPRPSVGFKFHAVLVVNSAHLASLSSPDRDRWLPIFWALDYFKSSQARDVREGNWTMPPVDESRIPSADKAPGSFRQAMDSWDVAAVDTAVTGLARSRGAAELFEQFALYGARDFRSIGHKANFVANSWRALQCIGWQHAEPVLRSLAYALLNHRGEPNPSKSDLAADLPWRTNQQRAKKIRKGWLQGKLDPIATTKLLTTLRSGSSDDACDMTVELLNTGVSPQSIYDALFLGSSELLVRQSGIVALHASTTTNAMHYAFPHGWKRSNSQTVVAPERGVPAAVPRRDGATWGSPRSKCNGTSSCHRNCLRNRRRFCIRPKEQRRGSTKVTRVAEQRRQPETVHRRRPSACVPQRYGFPRLQVQFCGTRGLL